MQTVNTIYWLDVQASFDGTEKFGWKTSPQQFNDDAVWGDNGVFGADPGAWNELVYPPDHPRVGQSIDLAFVINGVPEPHQYALLASLGLMGFAAWRRTTANRSRQ